METAVNAKLKPIHRPWMTIIAAGALSVLITMGIIAGVVGLFLQDGTPFERLADAERVCASYAFVSERDACMQAYLSASHVRSVASR
jgi:hypothetical protein